MHLQEKAKARGRRCEEEKRKVLADEASLNCEKTSVEEEKKNLELYMPMPTKANQSVQRILLGQYLFGQESKSGASYQVQLHGIAHQMSSMKLEQKHKRIKQNTGSCPQACILQYNGIKS
ncbi:hypothetical protein MKX03_025456 [Papaver bracteatum]|nr:hypothetical protein MKX03_025456 [Papaver bracteatum]